MRRFLKNRVSLLVTNVPTTMRSIRFNIALVLVIICIKILFSLVLKLIKGECITCGINNTQCAVFGLEATSFPSRSPTGIKLFFNTDKQDPYCS